MREARAREKREKWEVREGMREECGVGGAPSEGGACGPRSPRGAGEGTWAKDQALERLMSSVVLPPIPQPRASSSPAKMVVQVQAPRHTVPSRVPARDWGDGSVAGGWDEWQ